MDSSSPISMTNPQEHCSPNTTTNATTNTTTTTTTNTIEQREDDCALQRKKRAKTSTVWAEFKNVVSDGTKKAECIHCKTKLTILASGCTTHFSRHLKSCLMKKRYMNNQQTISFQAVEKGCDSSIISPAFMDGKLDMMKMRESVAHWILMHEHPFSIFHRSERVKLGQRQLGMKVVKISSPTSLVSLSKKGLVFSTCSLSKTSSQCHRRLAGESSFDGSVCCRPPDTRQNHSSDP